MNELFLSLLFSFNLSADEFKSEYQINAQYKAGAYLIYNCEGKYYACVDKDAFDKCSEKRKDSIDKKKESYSCAPLKQFENKTICSQQNYNVVGNVLRQRFCNPR